MNFNTLLERLDQLSPRTYGYIALGAIIGPTILHLLGLRGLAQWGQPLAILVLIGGAYAKQQRILTAIDRFRTSLRNR